MKSAYKLAGALLALALLTGCLPAAPQASSCEPSPAGFAENTLPARSFGEAGPAASGSAPSVSAAPASDTGGTALQFYDSFRDLPFAEIEYETFAETGAANKGSLSKNGAAWCACPGQMEFGERCFTDGTKLWIQVYLLPDEGFDWFQVCFGHFHEAERVWIDSAPGERTTQNKLFTHAEGYTVYTDDGFSFSVKPCPFEKDSGS